MYAALKFVHVTAVVLSGAGFVLRFARTSAGRLPAAGWRRMLPHAVDTVLLASALGLAWLGRFRLPDAPWLVAKIVGLALYILAGTIALKRGRNRCTRVAAFAGALAAFIYIVSVALTKNPLGPLAGGMT